MYYSEVSRVFHIANYQTKTRADVFGLFKDCDVLKHDAHAERLAIGNGMKVDHPGALALNVSQLSARYLYV